MPRIVTILLLVGGLAAANRYAPGVVQAVLLLTLLYLAVTHGDKLGNAFVNASAGLARGFGTTPAVRPAPAGRVA
jgi:hypothetical protein